MRALIALVCWLALSGPLALLVSRLIGTTSRSDDVGDEAERWLRSLVPPRRQLRDALLRTGLTVIVLAPVVVGGLAAVVHLPDAVTVSQADGQLALAWPPGQPDETTTTTTAPPDPEVEAAAVPQVVDAETLPVDAAVAPATEPTVPAPTSSDDPAAEEPPPSDAGGDDTGAPALADDEPGHDGDRQRCDPSGKGSREERCDDDGRSGSGSGSGSDSGDGETGGGDDGSDGGEDPSTTTTTTEPPAPDGADGEPVSPAPSRSSTALLTGIR